MTFLGCRNPGTTYDNIYTFCSDMHTIYMMTLIPYIVICKPYMKTNYSDMHVQMYHTCMHDMFQGRIQVGPFQKVKTLIFSTCFLYFGQCPF